MSTTTSPYVRMSRAPLDPDRTLRHLRAALKAETDPDRANAIAEAISYITHSYIGGEG